MIKLRVTKSTKANSNYITHPAIFSTAAKLLSNATAINSAHIHVTDNNTMRTLAKQGWEFMNAAYEFVPGGFLSFDDDVDMADSSAKWYLVYDGEAPKDQRDIEFDKVYCAVMCKNKLGLKVVAVGKNRTDSGKEQLGTHSEDGKDIGKGRKLDFKIRQQAALRKMYVWAMKNGWGEFSGAAEKVMRSAGGRVIDPQTLIDTGVFGNRQVNILDDGYYERVIGGHMHRKIALGVIDV